MFLSKWVERMGQIVAPDKNYTPPATNAEEDIWQRVAPDPNFEGQQNEQGSQQAKPGAAPTPSAFQSPLSRQRQQQQQQKVQCEHCHKYTPTSTPLGISGSATRTPAAVTATSLTSTATTMTPPGSIIRSSRTAPTTSTAATPVVAHVQELVMQSACELAQTLRSPVSARQHASEVLSFCCNTSKPVSEKAQKNHAKAAVRMKRMLQNDPTIFFAHAVRMGNSPPDGYTPLMAAAYANNMTAAELLLETGPVEQLLYRNLQGKTAFHIASEMGHIEMTSFLRDKHLQVEGAVLPVDLTGATPYGTAMTSPEPKAKSNREQLSSMLFSPDDASILGSPAPVQQRVYVDPGLQLAYGFADMPGKRIAMEDAMATQIWNDRALFCVCDGHGDGGRVSEFVAHELPPAFQKVSCGMSGNWNEKAKEICLAIDAKLKKSGVVGGSTAIMALVTPTELVVANVGDSRAILIQCNSNNATTTTTNDDKLPKQLENLTLGSEGETPGAAAAAAAATPPAQTAPSASEPLSWKNFSVIALSEDHKPSLEGEKARIEAAGLNIVEEKYTENGEDHVIHKIKLSGSNLLATSRAFGDFEYKANKSLSVEQQAVVAVPDTLVREREPQADGYLVLACDGIFDVMSNEQVGQFVVENINKCSEEAEEDTILPIVADRLLAKCLELGSTDNMSLLLVALSSSAEKLTSVGVVERKALDFESTC